MKLQLAVPDRWLQSCADPTIAPGLAVSRQRLSWYRMVNRSRRAVLCLSWQNWLSLLAVLSALVFQVTTLAETLGQSSERLLPVSSAVTAAVSPDERARLQADLSETFHFLQTYSRAIRAAAAIVAPSVVHIDAAGGDPTSTTSDSRRRPEESGAGVIIRLGDKNYILTNRHVIAKATPSTITIRVYDGTVLRPTAVWSDRDTDLALLAVDAANLQPAELGDSDQVGIGEFVLAVGSPFGLRHTVTFGIISAAGRRGLQLGHAGLRVQNFLQTDAAINPGNSGGPLVNLKGQVIGINTAIASNSGGNEGIGFAIPINLALRVAQELAERGRVRWGYLGVNLEEQFDFEKASRLGLDRATGALVTQVVPGSPAAQAGLKTGDVILKLDQWWIEDGDHLIYLVSTAPRDKPVPILVWRDRKAIELEVRIGERLAE